MAEGSDVVRTRRIEVVDDEGRVRAVLGLLGQGDGETFGLVVRDGQGRDRAWVVAEAVTAEVGLDSGGETVAALTVDSLGGPDLFLADGTR